MTISTEFRRRKCLLDEAEGTVKKLYILIKEIRIYSFYTICSYCRNNKIIFNHQFCKLFSIYKNDFILCLLCNEFYRTFCKIRCYNKYSFLGRGKFHEKNINITARDIEFARICDKVLITQLPDL